jgi:hypothetical protein
MVSQRGEGAVGDVEERRTKKAESRKQKEGERRKGMRKRLRRTHEPQLVLSLVLHRLYSKRRYFRPDLALLHIENHDSHKLEPSLS